MKKSLPLAIGLCLSALSSQSYASANVAGTYSGTFHGVNSGCNNPVHDGAWSQFNQIILVESSPGNFTSQTLTLTNTKTTDAVDYDFTQISTDLNGASVSLSGSVTTSFGVQTAIESFTGSGGTDSMSVNFPSNVGSDNCTTNIQANLIKTVGPGSEENNTSADTVHQAFAAGDNVMVAANHQSNNVKTRINTLKHRSSQPKNTRLASNEFFDASQLNISIDGQAFSMGKFQKMLDYELSGGSAGDSPETDIKGLDTGFGFFINGNTSFGDSKTSVNQQGYNFNSAGVTLGGDYRFTDNFFMGLAFGYNGSDTNYESNKGDLSTDTYSATLYTTYNQPNGYFIDFVARYGYSDIKGQRRFAVAGSTDYTMSANSNYSSNDYGIDIETGWEFIYAGLSFQPYVGVSLNYGEMSAYVETVGIGGATNNDLFGVGTQRSYSAQTTLGADLSYVFSTDYAVLVPRFNFEWHHEFLEDYARVVDSYSLDPTKPGTTSIFNDTPDSDYFSIGGGLSAALPYGLSTYLNYNTVLSTSLLTSHNINGGVRWNF